MASNINQIINCMNLINENLNIDSNDKLNLLQVMLNKLNEINNANNNIKIEEHEVDKETEIVEGHEVDKETEIVEGPKIDDRIDCIKSNNDIMTFIFINIDEWYNLYKYKNFDINDMCFVQQLYKKCPSNDIIKYVINNCNNLNAKKINDGFDNKFRPIHFVCYYANTEIIKFMIDLLIEKNIKLNPKTGMDSQPIHFICQRKDIESLKYLLSKNHNNDLNLINKYNYYPISYLNNNDTDILNMLVNNGAKIDFKNKNYCSITCIKLLKGKQKYEINKEILKNIFKNFNNKDKILLKKSNDKLKFIIRF
jgi:hypothetical protein